MTQSGRQETVVLAISRQLGSGGSYIGQGVARRLGLKYADREILEQAAQLLGVDEEDLAQLEERVSSLWWRVGRIFAAGPVEGPYTPPRLPGLDEGEVFEAESRIVREIADRDDSVIVGRGAFYVLRHHQGAIRILVHAPGAWRARRLMQTYGISDEAAARALVQESDTRRGKFVQTMTEGTWPDATRFDLCLNTATIGLDAGVDLVADIVSRRLEARGPRTG
jgi:CMP/dCMP kinase